jgi:hypothetical protein
MTKTAANYLKNKKSFSVQDLLLWRQHNQITRVCLLSADSFRGALNIELYLRMSISRTQ